VLFHPLRCRCGERLARNPFVTATSLPVTAFPDDASREPRSARRLPRRRAVLLAEYADERPTGFDRSPAGSAAQATMNSNICIARAVAAGGFLVLAGCGGPRQGSAPLPQPLESIS
jgi:hypothetical protein